jgi:hypothetical protein
VENGCQTNGSIEATFRHPKASVNAHFSDRKLLILAGKRQIGGISKICAGICAFLQPVHCQPLRKLRTASPGSQLPCERLSIPYNLKILKKSLDV